MHRELWTVEKTLPNQGREIPPRRSPTISCTATFSQNHDGTGGVQIDAADCDARCRRGGVVLSANDGRGPRELRHRRQRRSVRGSVALPVNRVKLRVYALCGLTAGIAAVVNLGWFSTTSSSTGYGLRAERDRRGGRRRGEPDRRTRNGARGAAGALVIRLIENGIYKPLHLNQEYSLGIVGAAIIIAAAIDRPATRSARRGWREENSDASLRNENKTKRNYQSARIVTNPHK